MKRRGNKGGPKGSLGSKEHTFPDLCMVKEDNGNGRLSQSTKLGDRRTMNMDVASREGNCSLNSKRLSRVERPNTSPSGAAKLLWTSDYSCLPSC